MKNALIFVASLLALTLGTGCTRRGIVAFADHDTKPLTAIHVSVEKSYLVFSTYEYVFYSCSESGDNLSCKRLCGGSNDTVCPEASQSGAGVATNIR